MAKKKSTNQPPETSAAKAERSPARPFLSVVWDWSRSIVVAVGLALLIRWPVGEPFKIPSGSMEPTLAVGDRIFVNKYVYGVRYPFNGFRIPFTSTDIWYSEGRLFSGADPERWDIVVFKSIEPGVEMHTLVKRVVGLPGERVLIRNGRIVVNGEPVDPPEGISEDNYTTPFGVKYGIVAEDEYCLVPPDHYLVLGDNSAHSRDGRYWGFVPKYHILGRVACVWWPIGRWHDFTGFSATWWWRLLVGGLLAYAVARMFLGRSWRLYDDALGAELPSGTHVFINFIVFGLRLPFVAWRVIPGRAPRRGDIVLYQPSKESGHEDLMLLGRVAGLPTERVHVEDGALQVNDAPLDSGSPLDGMAFPSVESMGAYGKAKGKQYSLVPEGAYFILVNDGSESPDSRTLGWIPPERIVGKATVAWWPLGRACRIR